MHVTGVKKYKIHSSYRMTDSMTVAHKTFAHKTVAHKTFAHKSVAHKTFTHKTIAHNLTEK